MKVLTPLCDLLNMKNENAIPTTPCIDMVWISMQLHSQTDKYLAATSQDNSAVTYTNTFQSDGDNPIFQSGSIGTSAPSKVKQKSKKYYSFTTDSFTIMGHQPG